MSKPELTKEELRRWSAEVLMEWKVERGIKLLHSHFEEIKWVDEWVNLKCWESDWKPDSKDAPAWQILAVIKKMREKGFQCQIWCMKDDFRVVFYKNFRDWRELRDRDYHKGKEFGETTLKAAYAALS